jgi:hypothetical protein
MVRLQSLAAAVMALPSLCSCGQPPSAPTVVEQEVTLPREVALTQPPCAPQVGHRSGTTGVLQAGPPIVVTDTSVGPVAMGALRETLRREVQGLREYELPGFPQSRHEAVVSPGYITVSFDSSDRVDSAFLLLAGHAGIMLPRGVLEFPYGNDTFWQVTALFHDCGPILLASPRARFLRCEAGRVEVSETLDGHGCSRAPPVLRLRVRANAPGARN